MRSEEIRPSDDRVQEPLLNAKPQSRATGQQSRECSFFSNALCPGPNAFPPPRFLCKLTRNIWSIWAAVRCRERHYGDLTAYSLFNLQSYEREPSKTSGRESPKRTTQLY